MEVSLKVRLQRARLVPKQATLREEPCSRPRQLLPPVETGPPAAASGHGGPDPV